MRPLHDSMFKSSGPLSASPAIRFRRRALLQGLTGGAGLALLGGCAGTAALSDLGFDAPRIRIDDEFGPLRAAIVHDASTARDLTLDEQRRYVPSELLAEHPEAGASSRGRLILQHEAFCKTLADARVKMLSPVSRAGAAYQVFARDPSFAVGDTLFVAQMKDAWRADEGAGLLEIRRRYSNVVGFAGTSALIEGGDVMVMDKRRVLVGIHRNTTDAGAAGLSAALRPSGIEVIRIPHRALHLDCCFAPLPDGTALIAAAKLPESSVALLRPYYREITAIDRDEAALHLATNLLWIDRKRVVSNRDSKKTNAVLRAKGFRVTELDFSQFVSLWGGFRSVVCPLDRAG